MYAQVERKANHGPVPTAGDMPETVRRVERMFFDRSGGVYTIRGEGSNEFQDAMYDGGGARRYFLDDELWDEAERGDLIVAMAVPENAEEQAHLEELTGAPVPIVPAPELTRARAPRAKAPRRTPRAVQTRTPAQILADAQALGRPGQPARGKRLLGDPPMQSHEARELILHAENNVDLWNRRRPEFLKNSIRRKVRNTYDSRLAVKLWEYFADEVAKSYAREYGGNFTKAQRREAAEHFRDQFEDAWNSGELRTYHPELFPKGATTVAKKKAKKKSTRKKPRTAAQKRATKKLVAANKKKKAKKKATKKKAKKKATKKRTKKKAAKTRTKKKATKRRSLPAKTVYII